ncbi:hypothetical protein [cf. Phormidesmis sp. LEGE 11477]|uniref:hypothetical protein n=1 Tax=cf. Phormidesmis sp. LEGE 11477 TaxID=1828680 RepID=UPI00187FFA85|nr:hypothetical protein [cf. Phormidesmis sp. LEGE 11477]MBE9060756.1 hypothetical protein [cf. Phormidesmis sp. LEGE 11477]
MENVNRFRCAINADRDRDRLSDLNRFATDAQTIEFADGGVRFIRVWMNLAIAIGVILPAAAFVIGFRQAIARKIFGFYSLLLSIQIVTEQILSQIWMPSLVITVGTLYTAFRVWQLWQGLRLIHSAQKQRSRHKLLTSILWLVFCFWFSNLVMLLTLAWPTIL